MVKKRVLFLCTHNSARSQMAEGLLRHLAGDRFEAFSAGTEQTHVRPLATRAMAELGVDISGQQSKTLDRYLGETFDAVITVCDQANESCPVFPGAKARLHWSFPDPSRARGSDEEQLAVYRTVRDAVRERIEAELLQDADVTIRAGRLDDVPALAAIYNHYVTTGAATFDVEPASLDNRLAWFAHYAETGPHRLFVAEDGDGPIGYATSSPFREKPAYRTSIETSVYVHPDARGRSIGSRLYTALFQAIADEDLHRAYAGVTLPNPASLALHRRFGFTDVGVYREVGRKFDRYWDVHWLEKALPHAP